MTRRRRRLWLLLLVAVVSPLARAQAAPLTYAAASDRTVRSYPPRPALGGAGSQLTDPTFGSKMLRVTDENTRPDIVGRFWASPSSAETSAWNTDSTRFFVIGGGGEIVPYRFDPATMAASRMGDTSNATGGLLLFFGGEPSFSFADPDVLYGVDWSARSRMVAYRFSTATAAPIHDVQGCLPGVAVHEGNVSVSKDDRRLLHYVGGVSQNLDTYVYVYDRALGCRWLNTQTGQVGGAWGPTGAYRGESGWLIHNARISKNGAWARITASTGATAGEYFWNVETLDLISCSVGQAPYCGGHLVTGFDTVVNQRGLSSGMDFAIRPMSAPDSTRPLITPLLTPAAWGADTHPSWNNVQADERQPVCMSAYRADNLILGAWDGEIICIATDPAASTVWRFAHHRSQYVSFWDSPRANVSQDGRFALFTSNWELTLGLGPDGPRRDAFIVQLAPPVVAGVPVTYAAPSDRGVYAYPPLPALGAAGYRFTDPTFGSRMVRVTDAGTRPDIDGRFWASPGSAETSAWNTDSTAFFVIGGGGEVVPYRFDPVAMLPSRMGDTGNGTGGLLLFFGGEPSFSFADPDVLYGVDWTERTRMVAYHVSTATQRTVHDVRACLPGVPVHDGNVSVTKDDQRLLTYVGGAAQGLDTYVYVYDRALGCRWLNTQTGEVGGAWGPTGTYRGEAGWFVHSARVSKNGTWARIVAASASAAGVYFWNVETLDVIPCSMWQPPNFCGGHLVAGFDTVINQRGLQDGMDFAIRPMSDVQQARALITPLLSPSGWSEDAHLSWNNVQSDEKQPVCLAVYRADNLVQRALDGEIVCIATDAAAPTVWRFAHHRSQYQWFWDSPRANVSQDGRFALFTSNWELTLGAGPYGPRDDAFIVELAPHP